MAEFERLTNELDKSSANGYGGILQSCCAHYGSEECIGRSYCDGCAWEKKAWERLIEYENTGYSPDEINRAVSIQHWENTYKEDYERKCNELLAYTDSRLTPERAKELGDADKEGKLVILPPTDQHKWDIKKFYPWQSKNFTMKICSKHPSSVDMKGKIHYCYDGSMDNLSTEILGTYDSIEEARAALKRMIQDV